MDRAEVCSARWETTDAYCFHLAASNLALIHLTFATEHSLGQVCLGDSN